MSVCFRLRPKGYPPSLQITSTTQTIFQHESQVPQPIIITLPLIPVIFRSDSVVGRDVGLAVGRPVGLAVGHDVGLAVGRNVGDWVGGFGGQHFPSVIDFAAAQPILK
jgi:hypothetical protein